MPCSFLQSTEWEAFQRSVGRKTWRADGALVIRHDLPLGLHYLYCPRLDLGIRNQGVGMRALDDIKKIAVQERSIFLKIDPLAPLQTANYKLQVSVSIQPRQTILLDLCNRSAHDILAAMHEKTRYNIRLAERKGVEIVHQSSAGSEGDNRIFWELLRQTAARERIRTHPQEYYQKMTATSSEHFSNELFFARYQGTTIAGALINFYRGITTYLHGASQREHKAVMAPHLLQWRIIQEAQRRGCAQYDFWGIDEQRWPGITRFKRGFGGHEISYPPSVNAVYRPVWYALYAAVKKGQA